MIITIQCASSKLAGAPGFRSRDGRKVTFVARPQLAPPDDDMVWEHPDAPSEAHGLTWRQLLERNNANGGNPLGLIPAWRLYEPPAYRRLIDTFGTARTLILSAGWGLVRAGYPLPPYDITFSRQADPYKRRREGDEFSDFAQLDGSSGGPLVFLGGKDYLPLFAKLTRHVRAEKIVPFRCDPADTCAAPEEDCELTRIPFRTAIRTNWHYACVERLCSDPTWLARR